MTELAVLRLAEQAHERVAVDADQFIVIAADEEHAIASDQAVIDDRWHPIRQTQGRNRADIAILENRGGPLFGDEYEMAPELVRQPVQLNMAITRYHRHEKTLVVADHHGLGDLLRCNMRRRGGLLTRDR